MKRFLISCVAAELSLPRRRRMHAPHCLQAAALGADMAATPHSEPKREIPLRQGGRQRLV